MTEIVITGLGATTPLGGDLATTWSNMLAGKSGVRRITEEWAEELPVKIAAYVAQDPSEVIDRVKARRLDRSTQLALIAAQFRRYEGAQIFAFDKGRSLLPITLAAGGDHYEIGGDRGGEGAGLAFCPLSELATDGDRAWASEWIESLVALQGVTITPEHRNAISRQVSLMAEARGRSLSDFVSGVQMREIKDALHHYTVDGPMFHRVQYRIHRETSRFEVIFYRYLSVSIVV